MALILIDGEVLVGRLQSLQQIDIVQASAIMKCVGSSWQRWYKWWCWFELTEKYWYVRCDRSIGCDWLIDGIWLDWMQNIESIDCNSSYCLQWTGLLGYSVKKMVVVLGDTVRMLVQRYKQESVKPGSKIIYAWMQVGRMIGQNLLWNVSYTWNVSWSTDR